MPLYEYKCLKCGRRTEKIETVAGPHLKKCPHCGGKVEAMISAPAIQFKGSGWYVTDYAGKSNSGSDKSEKGKDEKSSSEKKDSDKKDSSATDSGSKESSAKETTSSDKKSEKSSKKK